GVFVPPGRHTVVLDYRPRAFVVGSAVSGVALALALVAVAVPRTRRPKTADPEGLVERSL
ncbi:MAG: YfhO family protein, partial [Actinomycetota bacterium]|nr:YfhO family protein [Actinomycetota bacterium]